jgi:hypothetical protein
LFNLEQIRRNPPQIVSHLEQISAISQSSCGNIRPGQGLVCFRQRLICGRPCSIWSKSDAICRRLCLIWSRFQLQGRAAAQNQARTRLDPPRTELNLLQTLFNLEQMRRNPPQLVSHLEQISALRQSNGAKSGPDKALSASDKV